MKRYRLNWKGVIFSSEALLYASPDTPQILLIPILLLLYLPKLFLSYLKLSNDGIELFYWPNYRLKTNWENIDRLGTTKYLGNLTYDALYLRGENGETTNQDLNRQRGIQEKRIIALSDFRGWPNGKLFDKLILYIPGILKSSN